MQPTFITVQICAQVVSEELAHRTHCNSVQQIDSYGHTANVPGRRKGSMAPSGHSWKKSMTVVETGAIGPVVTALVADRAGVIEEPGRAALQMLSARHLLVVHMQTVKDL
jgi:hypothetical protein